MYLKFARGKNHHTIPSKQGTNSPKAPEAKHVEKAIWLERRGGNFSSQFRRDCGYDIKGQPGTCILPSNLLWIVDKEVGSFIQISYKEGKNDIHSKETIDNIISNGERCLWFLKESKFERGHPSSIEDQKNQKSLPCPAIISFIWAN